MARISDGSQERFIWPVHLAGWQQQGWTLIAAAKGVQFTAPPWASTVDPTPDIAGAEPVATWELETSPDDELLLDDPLL